MEILGIGPMELVLILMIALMVFGPEKLPEIGAKLGQSVRTVRKATREFSREIDQARAAVEAPLNEFKQPFNELKQPFEDLKQPFNDLKQPFEDLKQPFKEATAPLAQLPAQANETIAGAAADFNAAFEPAPADVVEVQTPAVPGSEVTPEEDRSVDTPTAALQQDSEEPAAPIDPMPEGAQPDLSIVESQAGAVDPSQLARLAIGVINPQEALRQVIARQLRPVSEA